MSLVMNGSVPTRIDRYEIEDLVGEGGMGRVYRARDTQLGRTVAIKVLAPALTVDPDQLLRFEQEARATAALSHPGVLAVHDVGTFNGAPYLVSELLEGSSLAERLRAERLSVDRSTRLALQIAEALAAAHDKGIVHRDLKPDNVFVTPEDRIKILDFGLAKLTAPLAAPFNGPDATVAAGTIANTILGTPGYMAPEQARGQPADHRSDIFALGCILYEMLQGDRAFGGETTTDVLSAILKDAPPPLTSSVERPITPALDGIVHRCLAKEPAGRFQSASDLAFSLRSVLTGSEVRLPAPGTSSVSVRSWRPRVATAATVAGAAVLGAALGWLLHASPDRASIPVTEFLVPPPTSDHSFASQPLPGLLPTAPQAELSPDGRLLAFVSTDATGLRKLWIRSVENSRPRALEGTDDATSWPFWSPDSRFVVFAARRALVKVDVVGGTAERLSALPDQAPAVPFVTGTWNDRGTILFSVGGSAGLYRVSASGGRPEPLTALDKGRGDHYHSWPQFLPDDRFLFFVRTDDPKTNGVYAGNLNAPETSFVMGNATRAVYAAGHLLWSFENRLLAQPFDTAGLQLTGGPLTLAPSIFEGAGRTPGFWASDAGVVAYAAGTTRERQFQTVDRSGEMLASIGPPGFYATFDASPDLSRVVVQVAKEGAPQTTLAIVDAVRGALTPLTLGDQHDSDPRFGPDGDVVFARNSQEGPGILRVNPARPTPAVLFPRGALPVVWIEDWAPDASAVVFRSGANRDAWLLPSGGTEAVRLTDAREPIEQVQLSPDGRLIAYSTAESGRQEIFVAPVPFTGERWQISASGGVQPTWRADGRELYFLSLDGGLYSVEINREPRAIRAGPPVLLFTTPLPVISAVIEQYRPGGDGQRFLFCLPLTSVGHEPLRMLLNWPERLRQIGSGDR
jgi:serine/threonine protein kinase